MIVYILNLSHCHKNAIPRLKDSILSDLKLLLGWIYFEKICLKRIVKCY